MKRSLLLGGMAALFVLVLGVSAQGAGSMTINKSLAVDEKASSPNNSQTFQLRLVPAPTDTTQIDFYTNQQCTLAHSNESATTGGSVISGGDLFDFAVYGVADEAEEGDHSCLISFDAQSNDVAFGSAQLDVIVAVTDDPSSVFKPLFTTEIVTGAELAEGSQSIVQYRVKTNREVNDPVTIQARGGSDCDLIVDNQRQALAELTIPTGGTATALFTVAAKQDDIYEGFHSCIINNSASTIDLTFSGLSIPPVVLSVRDDDPNDLQNQLEAQRQNQEIDEINERGVVDFYDANNDDVDDSKQANVQAFVNQLSGLRQALEVDSCDIDGSVENLPEQEVTPDRSIHFPYGALAFRLNCDEVGGSTQVKWILDQQYPASYPWLLRKIGADGSIEVVSQAAFADRALQTATVTEVSYTLVDGGFGDADGVANGVIDDPIGLGLPLSAIGATGIPARSDVSITNTNAIFYSLVGLAAILSGAVIIAKPQVQQWLLKRFVGEVEDEPQIDKY